MLLPRWVSELTFIVGCSRLMVIYCDPVGKKKQTGKTMALDEFLVDVDDWAAVNPEGNFIFWCNHN